MSLVTGQNQYGSGNSLEMDTIIKKLNSQNNKLDGLNELGDLLSSGCSTASFLGQLEKLFAGLRSCLILDDAQMETVLRANTILIDVLPDIQHSDDLEIQFAQLMPSFIENLGSSKAVVRKSTHKCIATYVKVSKKLEFVILHLIYSGLESQNTRTRQHSMLVIPALLSLKPVLIDRGANEVLELIKAVIKRLRDPQDIVAKTARKLLIEINKCYPQQFENIITPSLKTDEERLICKAVLRNDEEEIQRVLNSYSTGGGNLGQLNKRNAEESKQNSSYSSNQTANNSQQRGIGNSSYQGKELSIVGKEILQSNNALNQQLGSAQVLDKIIYEAKEESRYPKAQNGQYFGILDENLIEALNENNQWKERTNAIEAIESKLNLALNTDKKMDFMPYATAFLGFMIQFIADINFKISLSSIKIISKLLSMNLINFKKYYAQLVSALVEKLSDSKVVIRQAVLKCSALIITNYKASTFAFHVMRYLQHGNWHVREGAIYLIAHCVISQLNIKTQNAQASQGLPQTPDSDTPLSVNPTLIQEICSLMESEDKQKNQQYTVDLLALMISKSPEKVKSQQIIQKQLGLSQQFKTDDEVLNHSGLQTKEFQSYKSIIERIQKGNLPFINEENVVEFPILTASNMMAQKTASLVGQTSIKEQNSQQFIQQETLASNKTKPPSESFLEMKRKQEEEKKTISFSQTIQQQPSSQPQQFYQKFAQQNSNVQQDIRKESIDSQNNGSKDPEKISMWLPSFSNPGSAVQDKQNTQINQFNRNVRMSQNTLGSKDNDQFNATASSVATYLDDGKSLITSTSLNNNTISQSASKNQNNSVSGLSGLTANLQFSKSPLITEKTQIINTGNPRQNAYSQQITAQNQSVSNFDNSQARLGYTPQQHSKQPRSIQSTEIRQRTIDSGNYSQGGNSAYGIDQQYDFNGQIPLNKNMSQSTGVSGFNLDKGPQVSDRLKLLKSNQKYNNSNSADSSVSPSKYRDNNIQNQEDQYFNNEVSDKLRNINTNSGPKPLIVQKERSLNVPIKATHQEYMQTINNEDVSDQSPNATPNILKSKKPPLTQKSSLTSSKNQPRAQSVDNQLSPFKDEASSNQNSNADIYQLEEQPLQNPEKSMQQALDQLKSGDWQKQFEACNTIRRICTYHKNLFTTSNPLQSQILKEQVKLVDSLRSQLAKNSILSIKTAIDNLPLRDMDIHTDLILPALLKKAADTNVFISESSDAALVSVCSTLSEQRVFNCLQGIQNVKSNPMKIKMAFCYNILIEKIGTKIKTSPIMEKLISSIVSLLNEGAIEVRNMAKIGILTLKNSIGSQRELEGILNRCVSNEKQMEKIRQILDKGDFDSISNNGSTRYGSSMRASSLDRSSAGPFRQGSAIKQPSAAGSDGFSNYTQSSDFLKSGGNTAAGSNGFGSTSNTFKKTNNLVSKPIDPQVMEEFKTIINDMTTNDWNKRLKTIDTLTDFVKNNTNTIKSAPPAKFIQLIDAYCRVLNDNNIKVLSHAQQNFRIILLNQNLKNLIEQNLTMIVQALNNNLQSTNASVRDQGDLLFSLLEGAADPNLLIPPFAAQINLANNRSKAQLIEKLSSNILILSIIIIAIIERSDKPAVVQKYVSPLVMSTNKIQSEASSNPKLREALMKLQVSLAQSEQITSNQPIFNQDKYY